MIYRFFMYGVLFIVEISMIIFMAGAKSGLLDGKMPEIRIKYILRRIFFFFGALLSVFASCFILKDVPLIVNHPYTVVEGRIKEFTEVEKRLDTREELGHYTPVASSEYEYVIEEKNTHKTITIIAEKHYRIEKDANVVIKVYDNRMTWEMPNVVTEINGKKIVEFDSPIIDKIFIILLIIFNVSLQKKLHKKVYKSEVTEGKTKVFCFMWQGGNISYMFLLLIAILNVFDNYILGDILCSAYACSCLGLFFYLLATGGFELNLNKENPIDKQWEERIEALDEDVKKEVEELERLYEKEDGKTTLQIVESTTISPERGDVFFVSPVKGLFFYGVVLKVGIANVWGEELVTIAILKNNTRDLSEKMPVLEFNNLLLPPSIIEKNDMYKGYYYVRGEKIEIPEDFEYGFYSRTRKCYVDEYGEELSGEPQLREQFLLFDPETVGCYMMRELLIDKTLL